MEKLVLPVLGAALLLASCGGGGAPQPTPPVDTTSPTLHQGVWGWAAADASTGQIVQQGAMILFDEVQNSGRKVAVGAYTNEAQTQTGVSLLGPITATGELETFFSYDMNADDPRAYLVASDEDGLLEASADGLFFFGPGATIDWNTQQPNRAVYVALLQVSDQVPEELTAQAAAKTSAQALASQAVQRQFRTAAGLQAQALEAEVLQREARNILQRR